MKKFLLYALAAFAAVNVSAADGVKKANFQKVEKATFAADAHLGLVSKSLNAAMQAMSQETASQEITAIQKAPELSELIPCYSESAGMHLPGYGMFTMNMYEEASFLVKDGKAYFQPFSNMGMVEGVVEAGLANRFSEYGADSVTFTVDYIGALETGEKLFLEPCDWVDYTAVRMEGAKTFGAYYFAEYNELYIPDILALFYEDPLETKPYKPAYVVYNLDLLPQSLYDEVTCMGNATANSAFDPYDPYATDNAKVLFSEDNNGNSVVYVKGIEMSFNPDAWVKFVADENDESIYKVSPMQGLTPVSVSGDPAILVTEGAKHNGSALTGFTGTGLNNSYTTFKWSDNADETSSLTVASDEALGNYIIAVTADKGPSGLGFYEAFANMNINITYESIVGIKEVKGNKQQNDAIYNIAGQRVAKDYKGLVIKNGKKYLVK
jgi:hypothetical protein